MEDVRVNLTHRIPSAGCAKSNSLPKCEVSHGHVGLLEASADYRQIPWFSTGYTFALAVHHAKRSASYSKFRAATPIVRVEWGTLGSGLVKAYDDNLGILAFLLLIFSTFSTSFCSMNDQHHCAVLGWWHNCSKSLHVCYCHATLRMHGSVSWMGHASVYALHVAAVDVSCSIMGQVCPWTVASTYGWHVWCRRSCAFAHTVYPADGPFRTHLNLGDRNCLYCGALRVLSTGSEESHWELR